MSIETSWKYSTNGLFTNTLSTSERLWISGSTSERSNLEVGQWAPATLVTSSDGTNLIGVANNVRYVDENHLSKNEGDVVLLDAAFVGQGECTVQIKWKDTLTDTELTNCRFYAFNGIDPNIGPEEIKVVAFEHDGTAIRRNAINGDTEGRAWDENYGINGVQNALDCKDQVSSSDHFFYIGFSVKVTSYGTYSNSQLRLSFDVS